MHDADAYKAYQLDAAPVLEKFNAKFLTRAGRSDIVEGNALPRTLIVEFRDYDTAVACWSSHEYVKAKALRNGNSTCTVSLSKATKDDPWRTGNRVAQ